MTTIYNVGNGPKAKRTQSFHWPSNLGSCAQYPSIRKKALPVVRDNQNLFRTINSYHEVVRLDNHLCGGYFHITLFISQVTVRVENFDYSGELLLVI